MLKKKIYNKCAPLNMQDRKIWILCFTSAQSLNDLETIKSTMDTKTDLSPGRCVCFVRKSVWGKNVYV